MSRRAVIVAGATVVAAAAGAIEGRSVDPASYPWILWTWLGAILLGACWVGWGARR